jgi:transglutaminase-like putative cysteine protease
MNFRIVHTTEYEYSAPAIECYSELRVRPRNTLRQAITNHTTEVNPRVPLEVFTDYWGNWVEALSVPFRHQRLIVTSSCNVQTRAHQDAMAGLDLSISEAVHLYLPRRRELYDFLTPSPLVPHTAKIAAMAKEHLHPKMPFTPAILNLNHFIFSQFKYEPGATTISTPVDEVVEKRKGVCQDFAHVFLAVLRTAGIPARYVSGYIETEAQADASLNGDKNRTPHHGLNGHGEMILNGAKSKEELEKAPLVGATASHAWLEVCAPNGMWIGIDPTNDMLESERHVQIALGRDYADVAPLRGVFKGAEEQVLSVNVTVARTSTDEESLEGHSGTTQLEEA